MKILDKIISADFESRTAVAIGCFDGVHIGHREVIKKILDKKKQGMTPVVFTFVRNPKSIFDKKCREIIPLNQKYKILSDMGVDVVYSIDFLSIKNLSPDEFVRDVLSGKLNAGYVSCGFNFRFGRGGRADSEDLKNICDLYGIEVEITQPVIYKNLTVSSTRIRKALDLGDIKSVSELLGRPFGADGENNCTE